MLLQAAGEAQGQRVARATASADTGLKLLSRVVLGWCFKGFKGVDVSGDRIDCGGAARPTILPLLYSFEAQDTHPLPAGRPLNDVQASIHTVLRRGFKVQGIGDARG